MSEEQKEMADESVSETVCTERTARIEQKIDSLGTTIAASITHLGDKVEVLVKNQKERVDKHDEEIRDIYEQMVTMGREISSLVQWKANGERKTDISNRRHVLVTGIAVLVVGILSNSSKLIEWLSKLR